MKICTTIEEFNTWRKSLKGSVGFVPTMGALHHGHISLIEAAKKQTDYVVVSIFVNPTQFLEGEDFDAYPKREASDKAVCERMGVDCLFMPHADTIYFEDELSVLAPKVRAFTLEGALRPGHFDGVMQVVLKLFNIVKPQKAFFGKKDAQQLSLITLMVKTLFLEIEIIPLETVRESDGLALSSRNVFLSKEERIKALGLSKALRKASSLVVSKEFDCFKIEDAMYTVLEGIQIEYIAFVNRQFQQIDRIEQGNTIIALAAKIGTTRLIDNIWL